MAGFLAGSDDPESLLCSNYWLLFQSLYLAEKPPESSPEEQTTEEEDDDELDDDGCARCFANNQADTVSHTFLNIFCILLLVH